MIHFILPSCLCTYENPFQSFVLFVYDETISRRYTCSRIDNFAILYIYVILVMLSLSSFGIFPMKKVSLSVRLFNIRAGEQCKCLSVNILSPSTDCRRLYGGVKAKTHPCRVHLAHTTYTCTGSWYTYAKLSLYVRLMASSGGSDPWPGLETGC